MANNEVTATDPNRQLDIEILVRVFGYKRKAVFHPDWDTEQQCYYFIPSGKPKRTHMIDAVSVPFFSIHIADAWQVVDRMASSISNDTLRWLNYLELVQIGISSGFAASFGANMPQEWYETADELPASASGETAPLAICKAALKALDHEVNEQAKYDAMFERLHS